MSTSPKTTFLVFTDLDDTLFQTLHKKDVPGSVPMGYSKKDEPLSYACPKQQKLLSVFMENGVVIPTTARDSASFGRVKFPFTSYAILNFGATILLPNGALDETWHTQMAQATKECGSDLAAYFELTLLLERHRALGVSVRLIADFGLTLYILVKHADYDLSALDVIEQMWSETVSDRFVIRRNGNNLTLAPKFFSKHLAVQYLRAQHFKDMETVTIGAGDSLSDYEFMSQCDFFLTPSGSQLHEAMNKHFGGNYV